MTPEGFAPPVLRESEFAQIRELAYKKFGLDIKEGKQSLIVTRLSKELRRLGLTSFEQYCRYVSSDHSGEALIEMADALTTNFTSFLREQAHFQFLRAELKTQLPRTGPVNIWSCASSTGEEPYSILFTLLETLGAGADVRFLATDISTRALKAATAAVYEAGQIGGIAFRLAAAVLPERKRAMAGFLPGAPRVPRTRSLPALQPGDGAAREPSVSRGLLPQCGDLFR